MEFLKKLLALFKKKEEKKKISEDLFKPIVPADPLPRLNEMFKVAQAIALNATHEQNRHINNYFNKIIESFIDPFLLEIYRSDSLPIPHLNTGIDTVKEPDGVTTTVIITYGVRTIGHCVVRTIFKDGSFTVYTRELIQPEKEKTPSH